LNQSRSVTVSINVDPIWNQGRDDPILINPGQTLTLPQ
jgi:hypothetical protein